MNPELEQELVDAQDLFVWETPAYERYERGPRWYAIMALVAIALVAYAVWTSNFLFAFLILLGAILLVLAGNEHPPAVLVQVGENGVVWDGDLLPFDDIQQFSIVYQPPVKVLYVQPKSAVRPRLRIDLGDQDPVELRDHLKQYVLEDLDVQEEYPSDIFARLLRL